MQPVNGRLLVQVAQSQYKHVNISGEKDYQNASSEGEVIAVAEDLEAMLSRAFNDKSPIKASVFKPGTKVRWTKYAEQNDMLELPDPSNPDKTIRCALIKYEDITAYES